MKYIIANWKANKNIKETKEWLNSFLTNDFSKISKKKEIIICPPFPFLIFLKEKVKNYPFIKIGAQDLSVFEEGTYTGEVTGKTLAGLVDYVIIGHSERRKYFNETKEILFKKATLAKKNQIEPLFCIRKKADPFPSEIKFVVLEPPSAISQGTGFGANQPLKKVLMIKKELKINKDIKFIYGGSVNEINASLYLKNDEIDGVMIGGASLDPKRFFKIVKSL